MMRMFRNVSVACGWVLALLIFGAQSRGQAPLPLYTDHLVNGFQDWSWAPRSLSNTVPVHSGSNSISVSATAWQALAFEHADFDATLYASLVFWAHGGSGGGQVLEVSARFGTSTGPGYVLPALAANTWRQCVIPLSGLGAVDATRLNGFNIALTSSGRAGTFYIDDIQLTAKPAPALTHLSVNALSSLRAADARWFGVNAAIWDSDLDTPQTVSLLEEMGTLVLRFPGGSISDEYHWASNTSLTYTWTWATSFDMFARTATNAGAQAFITVNYGSGTADEAANWVRYSNITNRYGFKYWEIGNENYGTWETDQNTYPNDAYTYAMRARDYLAQMRAADATIKVGVVVTPGEDSSANGYTNHPATNALTGQMHYGWTPVLLSTLSPDISHPARNAHRPERRLQPALGLRTPQDRENDNGRPSGCEISGLGAWASSRIFSFTMSIRSGVQWTALRAPTAIRSCFSPPRAGRAMQPICANNSRPIWALPAPGSNWFAPRTTATPGRKADNPPAWSTAFIMRTAWLSS
jgi:hypothetical protein